MLRLAVGLAFLVALAVFSLVLAVLVTAILTGSLLFGLASGRG
jgi:hypothetical protein